MQVVWSGGGARLAAPVLSLDRVVLLPFDTRSDERAAEALALDAPVESIEA